MIKARWAGAVVLASAAAAGPARAQLTLRSALAAAESGAFPNRVAAAKASGQAGDAIAALRGILPAVRLEAGYARTTDPIAVFGSTLRQRAVTAQNFDPQRLNHPGPLGNYQGGVVVEQPLINADAWVGRRAATMALGAARAGADWTRSGTRVDVIRAYFGAALAAERATTLESAARAAHAHVSQANAMANAGLVTRSDALLASVRAGDIDAELIDAEAGGRIARRQLAMAIGREDGDLSTAESPPTSLPPAALIRSIVAEDTLIATQRERDDVRAAASGATAAHLDATRARAARLPRINSFARYDWNSTASPYAGDHSWTAGVMATWTLFNGAAELADAQSATGRAEEAAAQAEAARASARLDAEQTRSALAVALARLDIAERAVAQSTEAHRIVSRKYDGGLATVAELLDAQAAETASALAMSQARWGAIVAAAARRRSIGIDPATLVTLDRGASVAAAPTPDMR